MAGELGATALITWRRSSLTASYQPVYEITTPFHPVRDRPGWNDHTG